MPYQSVVPWNHGQPPLSVNRRVIDVLLALAYSSASCSSLAPTSLGSAGAAISTAVLVHRASLGDGSMSGRMGDSTATGLMDFKR
jgi:hypothetical protein